ncbi:MAG: hypothetical protein HQM09_18700 [Candidatus Riflebacteria bacterium]|nr:hypothetical protein [Candidatus Riflebacteria bacterium]
MRLFAENRSDFESCIDESFASETSIVSRYRNVFKFDDCVEKDLVFKQCLLECSIREGERVVSLMDYKGVNVHILDETSCMATGSLKSIDGCLTTSLCCMEAAERVAFESGGNTGTALTRYGRKSGLETFFFCPIENLDLLDSELFDGRRGHLIGVKDRGRVKELAGFFAKTARIRHIPDTSWRYVAAMFRGLFILEHMFAVRKYDWISQTISAGFGPIGIYNVLKAFQNDIHGVPRFLGVQQEANCPMFAAWKPDAVDPVDKIWKEDGKLLTRVMYDDSPQTYKTSDDFHQLLSSTNGDLLTVNENEFNAYIDTDAEYGRILELLLSRGISISLRSGQVIEKTGVIALVGTLKAIDAGLIEAGNTVLCCLTSGVTEADGRALPEMTVQNTQDILEYIKNHVQKIP